MFCIYMFKELIYNRWDFVRFELIMLCNNIRNQHFT